MTFFVRTGHEEEEANWLLKRELRMRERGRGRGREAV
jgi:hypothetical protein